MTYQDIQEAATFLRQFTGSKPETGIILGTGLGNLVDMMHVTHEIPYRKIPHFVSSTVETHAGSLLFGSLHGKSLVVMQGRFHFYEGYSLDQVTFPVRVMKLLGIQLLIVSNACGALNLSYKPGDLMLIDDHLNFLPSNPLTGKNIDELGPRFPDMSRPYDPLINEKLKQIAQDEGILLHEGVYAAWSGPNLETRAEYRFLRMAGADVVGMSTVPEVITANHMKLPVVAVSVITDSCDPGHLTAVSIQSILRNANIGGEKLKRILDRFFSNEDLQ